MLKKRELTDSHKLFELMIHPAVFPYVRQKAYSHDEFLFLSKQTIEAEERGDLISRTITNEWGAPIGTINLFDIKDKAGFLGTWIGEPYFGKGYNQKAKDAFFSELFFEQDIETIYMRIRKENIRSNKAALKLPYVTLANENRAEIYQEINKTASVYNLYEISKQQFTILSLQQLFVPIEDQQAKEA